MLRRNKYYVAEHWENGKVRYRRATLVDYEKGKATARIQLIDSGVYVDGFKVNRLRTLQPQFAAQPRFAIVCRWVRCVLLFCAPFSHTYVR